MTLTVWQVVLFLFLAATFGFVLCWFLKDYLLENFKDDDNEQQQASVKDNKRQQASVKDKDNKQQQVPVKDKNNKRQQAPVKTNDDSNPIDNLQEIKGISVTIESALKKLGITSFAQVAQLDSSNVFKGLENYKGNATRYKWAEQAKVLHKKNYGGQKQTPVKSKVKANAIDNLQEIKGISANAEDALNNSGITSFAQVAQFGSGNTIKGLERFNGNAKRYNWTEQAKALHRKKYGKDIR